MPPRARPDSERPNPKLPGILAGYHPLPGVSDELMDPGGRIRPVWDAFIRHLASLAPEEITRRFHRGDQYLRDAGVYFRQYGTTGSTERAWPLAHVPVLIEEDEWATITEGLIQRADLLETVMADLYGPGHLMAEGHLPPALIAGNPEWLRPLVGVNPRGGNYLHFLAFEIGRGPDGTWWVLADRTQAPSGAGFALENRVATSRIYSDHFADAQVHRLAGFFRSFRDQLMDLRADGDSRVAILTPGALNDTYFEHAYIARYLGLTLVQGDDLAVERGDLMVRTVSGLRPVSVLWRRLDSAYADPLELEGASHLGTPGLVAALRAGSLTMVNALGSGVLETRAMMAFLPRLSRALTGDALKLPNIATWWCGGADERAEVAAARVPLLLAPALSTHPPFEGQARGILAATLSPGALTDLLETEGAGLVAQEAVTLSTTPAWVEGTLRPRPLSLRVFLARTPDGWQVMPGGFARIGGAPDAAAVAMQRGGEAADVWVISKDPVDRVSMLPQASVPFRRPESGALPTRAADNLFWLGRYVERTEGIMRLTRAHHVRFDEAGGRSTPLFAAMAPLFDAQGIDPGEGIAEGLRATLARAIGSAGQVRDRFSPDGWTALADLDTTMRRMAERVTPGDDAARALSALLRKLSGFSGLVHENMYRFTGWRFLEIGRHVERALSMSRLLAVLADPAAPEGALDLAVEVGDSVMSHRRRFAVSTTRSTVIDLLALDALNPRAVLAQLDGMRDQIAALPGIAREGELSDLARAMLRLHTGLATERAETLDTEALYDLNAGVAGLSDLLTEAYLR